LRRKGFSQHKDFWQRKDYSQLSFSVRMGSWQHMGFWQRKDWLCKGSLLNRLQRSV
jgi:hypothetical protein